MGNLGENVAGGGERSPAEVLQKSADWLRLATEGSHLGLWFWDEVLQELFWDAKTREMFGAPADGEVRLEFFYKALHPGDRKRVIREWRHAFESGSPYEIEYRSRRPDGSIRWVHARGSAYYDDSGKPTRMVGVVFDITERKLADERLRESEERFRKMADTAPVKLWISDADRRFTFLNRRWLEFTGRSLEQAQGNGWVESVHPDDRERCLGTYKSSFEARMCFEMEYRLRRADGEYRWILHRGAPWFGSSNEFIGYIGSAVDITDSKRAQEEALSGQKLDSLTVLTRGIAHDFNNFMSAILAEAELAESDMAEGLSPREGIQQIKATATRAAEIVRQLMTYAGQEQSDLEVVDLAGLVEEMVELLKASISKHVHLVVNVCRPLPSVACNPAQIRQLLMNLVINASQAISDKDGVIKVCLSRAPGRQRQGLQGAWPDELVRFEVSDTGCGMTEAEQAKIFDPFFTTKPGGHGLGLAVVHGIVHSHRGMIRAVSSPQKGTMFEVFLPCLPAFTGAASPGDSVAPGKEIRVAPKTILLVEDEADLRIAVAKALRRRGFSVLTADEGWAAVEIFRSHAEDIEVVLLDSNLPGLSGPDILTRLRCIKPGARVILSSAYPPELAGCTSSCEQPSGFLRKPYKFADLMRALQDPGSKTPLTMAAFKVRTSG